MKIILLLSLLLSILSVIGLQSAFASACIECNDPSPENYFRDIEKPFVLIMKPDHNISVSGSGSMEVRAVTMERNSTSNSNWQVEKFEVFVDYVSVGSNSHFDIVNYVLQFSNLSRGTHTITFEATDNGGDKQKTSVYVVKQ